MARTRERMGTGTPKRRKKEGEFDRINEKRLPIPSKKTCWEIHLHLLEMPASVATPPAKRSLMSLRTTTSHSSSHLSPLHRASHPSITLHSPSLSSSLFLFLSPRHFICREHHDRHGLGEEEGKEEVGQGGW